MATKAAAKYRIGAFLKIPGGFTGRVTEVYQNLGDLLERDEAMQTEAGAKLVKGVHGGAPSSEDQYFYKCVNNGADSPLFVGELDARLIQNGPNV